MPETDDLDLDLDIIDDDPLDDPDAEKIVEALDRMNAEPPMNLYTVLDRINSFLSPIQPEAEVPEWEFV